MHANKKYLIILRSFKLNRHFYESLNQMIDYILNYELIILFQMYFTSTIFLISILMDFCHYIVIILQLFIKSFYLFI